ncbi:MAG: FliM/FliN family flagellar motor switch protein [Burkholderiales bacterium]|nr:FliM/FliN family flagellar motor switch protein [Burkholderiales bacterium]
MAAQSDKSAASQAAPQVRPFRLLSQTTLDALTAQVTPVVQQWAAQWGLGQDVALRSTRFTDVKASAWRQRWVDGERGIFFGWQSALVQEIQTAMFPPDHGNAAGQRARLAPIGAQQAFDALLAALKLVLLPPSALRDLQISQPTLEAKTGSGAILLQISIGNQSCDVLLNDAAVRGVVPAKSGTGSLPALGKVNLLHLLRDTPLQLEVEIGRADVPLGSLLTVGVGDVIKLKTALEQPVSVKLPSAKNGTDFCRAYLGKMQDAVAIELVATK